MRSIQNLTIEILRVSRNLSPLFLNDTLKQKDKSPYDLIQISKFSRSLEMSLYHRGTGFSFLGLKIWIWCSMKIVI